MKITKTKNLFFRLVELEDAEIILQLRLDDNLNKYLSYVGLDLGEQKKWIESYKVRENLGEEFYYIICNRSNDEKIGTVRIYEINNFSFSWGSWILNNKRLTTSAIESAYLIYDIGFNKLGLSESLFKVDKRNTGVQNFHLKTGAEFVKEDNVNFFYRFTTFSLGKLKRKYEKYLK